MSIRLVQLVHPSRGRAVAIVEEPHLRLLRGQPAISVIARDAIDAGKRLHDVLDAGDERLPYDPIYNGQSEWTLLSPFDHWTAEKLFITGTGLTHKASAENPSIDAWRSRAADRQHEDVPHRPRRRPTSARLHRLAARMVL
jgi:hypothetical protein